MRLPSARKRADVVGGDDAQLDLRFAQPVLHAFGRRLHRLDDVDILGLSSSAPASIEARSRMSLMIASRAAEDW